MRYLLSHSGSTTPRLLFASQREEDSDDWTCNQKEFVWGWTALHAAANRADLDMTKMLISHGASIYRVSKVRRHPFVLNFRGGGRGRLTAGRIALVHSLGVLNSRDNCVSPFPFIAGRSDGRGGGKRSRARRCVPVPQRSPDPCPSSARIQESRDWGPRLDRDTRTVLGRAARNGEFCNITDNCFLWWSGGYGAQVGV